MVKGKKSFREIFFNPNQTRPNLEPKPKPPASKESERVFARKDGSGSGLGWISADFGFRVLVLGFSLCPRVFGFGYPKSNGFGADFNLYPRIHRRGSGKQHKLPSKAADPAWPHTSSPRPTRLAAGALLRMGQSKAARPEAAPTGVDRPEAGPWPKASRQPARGRVQQLQSKQRAQQGFTAQPVSAQPHTVKQ